MREIMEIPVGQVKPERAAVLETQGIPSQAELSEEVELLLKTAGEAFMESSQPVCILCSISVPEFEKVYRGEGLNEKKTPLEEILKQTDYLALFAVTLGEGITDRIDDLFKTNDFALGSMLDSVASAAADKAAEIAEQRFLGFLSEQGKSDPSRAVMRFSPGYCGWHMSGQKKLFEFLHPEDIGIELLESFLMKPLKSISGVLVYGSKEIFDFEDSYGFCSECRSHSCRERTKALLGNTRSTKKKGAT
jgi:hypothetical protein